MKMHSLDSIITIDCNYLHPEFDAAYLIIEDDCAACIDNGTAHSHSQLLAAPREFSTPEQVQYIIITHVHLDHAGGTSALLHACPNAIVLAHERAARHIIKPDRLIQGTISVYGEHNFNRYFGSIEPVEETKVRIVRDYIATEIEQRGVPFSTDIEDFLLMDIELNAQGIAVTVERLRN
jgi:glyoxylase-like metal-dependent hydrolase (beta-lactamase superfamily II)